MRQNKRIGSCCSKTTSNVSPVYLEEHWDIFSLMWEGAPAYPQDLTGGTTP